MNVTINIEEVAKEMKKRGIKKVEDGWTNTLMDILEENYGIETQVMNIMKIPQD